MNRHGIANKHKDRPAQRQQNDAQDRAQDGARARCNWLRFWSACASKRCRRHSACSGDADACWERHWATMPEDLKSHLRLTIEFARTGMPWTEAAKSAVAEMGRRAAAEADRVARDVPLATERIKRDAPRARRL